MIYNLLRNAKGEVLKKCSQVVLFKTMKAPRSTKIPYNVI